jgi:lipopolysaccharide export system protein LptA
MFFVVLFGLSVSLLAEPEDKPALTVPGADGTNNTVITSEHLTFDYKRSIAVFEKNVVVTDPRITIKADRINVLFDDDNNVTSVTAIGNVRMKQENKRGTCQKAVYLTESGEIIMTGNPVLVRDKDTLKSKKITFWCNDDKVVCEPAQLIIFQDPEAEKKKDGSKEKGLF